MLGGNRVGSEWGGNGHWGGEWGSVGHWGSIGGLGNKWSGSDHSWDSSDGTVDGGSGWGLVGIDAWLVGGDGGTEAKSISHVVHSSDTTIGITETIGTNLHTWTALLLSEGAASGVVFIVTESVVAKTLKSK